MHLFDVLPTAKLNDLDLDWPGTDVTKGPNMWVSMLGERWQYSEKDAVKRSLTTRGHCGAGIYQMVRTHPTSTAALVVGRPLFWSDRKLFVVTPDITAAFLLPFAGVALNVPTTKGNVVMMCVSGDVDGLFDAALTKAVPVINDLTILKHTGGIAAFDVTADATAETGALARLRNGIRVNEAVTAGALSRIIIPRSAEIDFQNGVI